MPRLGFRQEYNLSFTMSRSSVLSSLFVMLLLAGCNAAVDTPEALLQQQHERWYRGEDYAVTFVQQTIMHRPDGRIDTTLWYEAGMLGKLRIDFAPIGAGNGMLFRDGKRFILRGGAVVREDSERNPLQLVLMDALVQPVSTTLLELTQLGFDVTQLSEAHWKGRPAYVIGNRSDEEMDADSARLMHPQVWVDQSTLHTVRILTPIAGSTSSLLDVHVDAYTPIAGTEHESRLSFYMDNRLFQEEIYTELRFRDPLPESLFDPDAWTPVSPYWE